MDFDLAFAKLTSIIDLVCVVQSICP